MTIAEQEQTYTFKAEIKQLLDILIHSLYKEPEIFVRELISNASDALSRVQFEMLTNHEVVDPDAELGIWLTVQKPEEGEEGDKWLIIKDTGIGMTADDLRQNLGTIAHSGAREFLANLRQNGNKSEIADVIGQFGVGFSPFSWRRKKCAWSPAVPMRPRARPCGFPMGARITALSQPTKATVGLRFTSNCVPKRPNLPTSGSSAKSSKSTPILSPSPFILATKSNAPTSNNPFGAPSPAK